MFDIALKCFICAFKEDHFCWDCFAVLTQARYKMCGDVDVNRWLNA